MKMLLSLVLGRRRPVVDVPVGERLCDGRCGRIVHPARAHTHHHEPGCGTSPNPWACSCSYWLCEHCCPCDVAGLLLRAVS